MKRREAKFVHASPRLWPDQGKAAPPVRETRAQPIGKRILPKTRRAATAARREKDGKRS